MLRLWNSLFCDFTVPINRLRIIFDQFITYSDVKLASYIISSCQFIRFFKIGNRLTVIFNFGIFKTFFKIPLPILRKAGSYDEDETKQQTDSFHDCKFLIRSFRFLFGFGHKKRGHISISTREVLDNLKVRYKTMPTPKYSASINLNSLPFRKCPIFASKKKADAL